MSSALVCYGLRVCFYLDGQSSVLDFCTKFPYTSFILPLLHYCLVHNQVDLDWLTALNLAKTIGSKKQNGFSLTSWNDHMCLALRGKTGHEGMKVKGF